MIDGAVDFQKLFLQEAEEQLQSLNESLLAIEKNPKNRPALDEMFRAAHSLKGGATTMGFDDLASLTHEMENLLDEIRSEIIVMTPQIADCMFHCIDNLNLMIQSIAEGKPRKVDIDETCLALRKFQLEKKKKKSASGKGRKKSSSSSQIPILARITEYDRTVIEDELSQHREVYEIVIIISRTAALRSMRGTVILNSLKNIGEVLKYEPDVDSEEADKRADYHFLVATEEPEDYIRDLVGTCDIDSVELISARPYIETGDGETEDVAAEIEASAEDDKRGQTIQHNGVGASVATETETSSNAELKPVAPQPDASKTASHTMTTIRVDTDRLDSIMNLVGELVINRTRFAQVRREIEGIEEDLTDTGVKRVVMQRFKHLDSEFDSTYQHMGRITNELQERIMQIRMLPISNVFSRFERVVRDLARTTGRKVILETSGNDTELDKTVIEAISEPFMHIVRNAIAHGIETPEERVAAGKPPEGRLVLRAYHEGNNVIAEIEDDGRGIDVEKLKKTAVRLGVLSAERAEKLTRRDALNLIFMPAFSTAETADSVSGRGVGLDVVSRNIERLNGIVDVKTEIGKGTKFTIRIPLTLAIIQALIVEVSGEVYAIPLVNIVEAVRLRPSEIRTIEGRETAIIRNSVISLLRMDEVLGLPEPDAEQQHLFIVVVGLAEKSVGLVVQRLRGQQDIVIKSLEENYKNVQAIAGASILGEGRVALILDVYALVEMGMRQVNREVDLRKEESSGANGAAMNTSSDNSDKQPMKATVRRRNRK